MSLRKTLRIAATGISFLVFGVGSFIFVAIIYPVVLIVRHQERGRQRTFRRIISLYFRTFVYMMQALGLLTFEIKGLQRLPANSVIIANHPSLIDVVLLLGWLPDATCVIKGALFRNFFTMGPVSCTGYINNDDPRLLDRCVNELKEKPLLIFAEGTRSTPGEPPRFLRGAANIALLSGAVIRPVTISMYPVTLVKYQAWWDVPEGTSHYVITEHDPWRLDGYRESGKLPSRQARDLTRDLEEFFTRQLAHDRAAGSDGSTELDFTQSQI